ncbi:MAG: ABC-type dipeptide transport system, periplasmic component [Firmicutes bacterium]|nr:ABC-type dipeptide transport system, periplasmic component [Bacillota bacterium]
MARFRHLIPVGLALALTLTACAGGKSGPGGSGGQAADGKPVQGGTLTVGVATEPNTVDVYQMTWSGGLENMFQSLLSRDFDYKYADGLAEKWTSSPDGKTWTFTLKQNVKFHDGTPFDAEAVKRHFETMRDKATAAQQASEWEWFESMTVVDPHTIRFNLKQPFPNAEFRNSKTYGAIQSPTAYAQHGPNGDKTYGIDVAVGTGPFKLGQYVPGDKLVMKRNPDYAWAPKWAANQGAPYIDQLVWRLIPDSSTRLTELETGNIQVLLDLPVEQYDRAKAISGVEVAQRPGFGLGYLDFRKDKAPFNNVKVRQAVNLAIDREAIVKSIFFGHAKAAYGLVPSELSSYYEQKDAHSLNVAKAKQLLQEAAYDPNQTIQLITRNRTEHVRIAEAVQPMLQAIGMKVEIVQYDAAALKAKQKEGAWQLAVSQYSWDDPDILGWFLYGKNAPSLNSSGWADKQTDQLFEAAESAPSPKERDAKYKELQQYLIAQAVWAPIWFPLSFDAIRTDLVKGYKTHPSGPYFPDLWLANGK